MKTVLSKSLSNLGFSQYELTAYISLVGKHPINGSQLSKLSGIPRARIYDVLRSLSDKGLVLDIGDEGFFVPLPPEEALKRIRHRFEDDLSDFEHRLEEAAAETEPHKYDFVWTIQGYADVMVKAREMIESAQNEIYTRLFTPEGKLLDRDLHAAEERGVAVRYISMGPPLSKFTCQVVHPRHEQLEGLLGGRTIDLITDRKELLVGMFEIGREDTSPVNWAKNHWFVVAGRDSLRHDFYHYFLHKIYELGQRLTKDEADLYDLIKNDH